MRRSARNRGAVGLVGLAVAVLVACSGAGNDSNVVGDGGDAVSAGDAGGGDGVAPADAEGPADTGTPDDSATPADLGAPDDTGAPQDDVLPPVVELPCTPLPALLAERRACSRDDHCPCGSYCALGLCTSGCTLAGGCGDGAYCDAFGRCRPLPVAGEEAAEPTVALQAPRSRGRVRIEERALGYVDEDTPRRMTLVADGGRGGPVRVVGGPYTQVALPEEGVADEDLDFADELLVPEPPPNLGQPAAPVVVVVKPRPDAQPPAGEPFTDEIVVKDESGGTDRVVLTEDVTPYTGEPPQAPTSVAGHYEGIAHLTLRGVQGWNGLRGGEPPRAVSTPVTVTVFEPEGGRAPLVIEDPLRLLHPAGRWVGTLVLGAAPTVELPPFEALPAVPVAGAARQLVAVPTVDGLDQDPQAAGWVGALSFRVALSLEGATPAGVGPLQAWAVGVRRTGDLVPGDSAPAPDAPAALTYDADDEAATPLPLEGAYRAATTEDLYPNLAFYSWKALWSAHREEAVFAPGPHCVDPVGTAGVSDPQRAEIFASFTEDALSGPYDLGSAYRIGRSWQAPEGSPPVSWSTAKSRTGDAVALNAPALRPVIDALQIAAVGAEPTLERIGVGFDGGDLEDYRVTLADGTVLPFAVPCAFSGRHIPPPEPATLSAAPASTAIYTVMLVPTTIEVDLCQALAESYGCQVLDLAAAGSPEAERTQRLAVYLQLSDPLAPEAFFFQEFGLEGLEVPQVCVFPRLPTACVETAVCDDAGAGEFELSLLGASFAAATGDLACEAGDRGLWLPADAAPASADELVAACAADLAALDGAAPAPTGATVRERLASIGWDAAADCLQPVRFLAALGLAGDAARELGRLAEDRADDTADTLFLRLLQRWLQLHAFAAGEAVSGAAVLDDFGGEDGVLALEQRLAESLKGWDLLLHPRVGAALLGVSRSALATPDYRRRLLAAAPALRPQDTQDDGLVATMEELLASQMELVALLGDRYARQGTTTMPDSIAQALHYAAVVDAWIAFLTERAREADRVAEPAWLADYQKAHSQFVAARSEGLLKVSAAVRGTNPLGIEDVDLPLYFNEIRTDAGGRFGAVSDFLLGDGTPTQGVAQQLVTRALDAFDDARAAADAEVARELNVANDALEVARRSAAAQQELGMTLQDLCGADAFGGLQDSEIPAALPADFSVERCWFRADRAECLYSFEAEQSEALEDALTASRLNVIRNGVCKGGLMTGVGLFWYCTDVAAPQGGTERACTKVPIGRLDSPVPAISRLRAEILARWTGLRTDTYPARTVSGRDIDLEVPMALIAGGTDGVLQLCDNPDAPTAPLRVDDVEFAVASLMLAPQVEYDLENDRAFLRCAPVEGLTGEPIVLEVTSEDLIVPDDSDGTAAPLLMTFVSTEHAEAYCDEQFPIDGGTRKAPSFDVVPASCYRGELGAQAIAVRSLTAAVEIARSTFNDGLDSYEVAMDACFLLQQGNDQLEQAQTKFNGERQDLVEARTAMAIGATWANNTADCLDSVAAAEASWQVGVAAGSCAARGVAAGFETAQLVIEANIEALDASHELTMMTIQQGTDEQICFKEAELYLVSADTARLEILRAMQELQIGYAGFQATLENARLAVARGFADIEDAEASGMLTLGRSPWFDRDVERYEDALALARRAAYLAVRAVEYEQQVSLSQRGVVLAAEHPDELDDVLVELRQLTATGTVGGARPAELTQVVSLRQHLLQLADRSVSPEGEQRLSDVERFRLLLQDPRYEVWEDGVFVGREIPFAIAPLSVLDKGQVTGVPIVSDASCAERLWSLNVAVQGDPAKMFRGLAPQVDLQVRKRNTFFANWCTDDERDDPFQVAGVRPSRNLFRIPGAGDGVTITGGDERDRFAIARVQAELAVDPGDFAGDAFTDGASTELAARLLYGEYRLFLPATSLAEVDADGRPASDGLILNQVDDILLRIDYLSVAR